MTGQMTELRGTQQDRDRKIVLRRGGGSPVSGKSRSPNFSIEGGFSSVKKKDKIGGGQENLLHSEEITINFRVNSFSSFM